MNTSIILNQGQGKCPFQKLNSRFQKMTKGSIARAIGDQQKNKHQGYVNILKRAFQANEPYFTSIGNHIKPEDVEHFQGILENTDDRITFLDGKLKEYFWNGFSFNDKNNLTPPELSFKTIGNLGLEDVAMIIDEVLSQSTDSDSLENMLAKIREEIDLRLKNNVLIDSILHLNTFPHKLITNSRETSAELIGGMIEANTFDVNEDIRLSPELVAEEFRESMIADGMIDEGGIIPQLTFGCPIINIHNGKVFKSFVMGFVGHFLATNQEGK